MFAVQFDDPPETKKKKKRAKKRMNYKKSVCAHGADM